MSTMKSNSEIKETKKWVKDFSNSPSEFEKIQGVPEDPIEFVKDIYDSESANRSGLSIDLSIWETETVNFVLAKFEAALPHVEKKVWERAWSAIRLGMDISEMGGETIGYRVMPNGAVAIRNMHRVISFDGNPINVVEGIFDDMVHDIEVMADHFIKDDDKCLGFAMMNLNRDGNLEVSRHPMSSLSGHGNTLVFVPYGYNLDGCKVLTQETIQLAQSNSRIGMVMIRLFNDRAFVYTSFRADDDYDTILEDYAEVSITSEDLDSEECIVTPVNFKSDQSHILEWVEKRVESRIDDELSNGYSFMPDETSVMYPWVKMLLAGDSNSYASRKQGQIMSLTPVIGEKHDAPALYFGNADKFMRLSRDLGQDVITLTIPIASLGSDLEDFIENGADNLMGVLDEVIDMTGSTPLMHRDVVVEYDASIDADGNNVKRDDVLALEEAFSDTAFADRLRAMRDEAVEEEGDYFDEADFMSSLDLVCGLIFPVKEGKYVDLNLLSDSVKQITASLDCHAILEYSRFGISQGYDCGDFDTGNANSLLLESFVDDEDDDDDEWSDDDGDFEEKR